MNNYKEALITGETLTHMQHTEDLFLYGEEAGKFAVKALKDVFSALKGNSSELAIKLKIDGSPSVIAASDFNGEAFVATKGFFAKDRRIARTPEDVDKYFGHAEDLARKMKKLLSYITAIGIPQDEVWQGDFLFDDESLKKDSINGEEMILFHPNTIIYAVPATDPLARKITRADVGVAWHTRYRGKDYDSLKISFDANVDELNNVPSVFQMDSRIPNLSGGKLTQQEEAEILVLLQNVEGLFSSLQKSGFLNLVAKDEPFQRYLLTYRNYIIKTEGIQEKKDFIEGMKAWVAAAFDKEIATKKQPSTQQKYEAKKQEELQRIEDARDQINQLILLQNNALKAKEFFVKKLNTLGNFRTLVKHIDSGYLPTGQEGYAISDIDGNVQKFVSRLEFSKNNFSQEIVKGWMSDARMKEAIGDSIPSKSKTLSIEEPVDDILSRNNLNRRKNLSKKKGTKNSYSTEVVPTEAIPRNIAAKQFADAEKDAIVNADIPKDGTRPIITIVVQDSQIELNFKDNNFSSHKMDAKATAEMETLWSKFMWCATAGKEPPTYEEAYKDFNKITEKWYNTFISGSKTVADFLLKTPYVFSREDFTVPPQKYSIHKLINTVFTKRRDLFKVIGSKKDAWNPSDIYAVVASEYDDLCESWIALSENETTTLDDINSFLLTLLQNKQLIGISLKKLTTVDNPSLELSNMNKEEIPSYDYKLEKFNVPLNLKSEGAASGAIFWLNDGSSRIKGQIRYYGASTFDARLGGNLQMELLPQKGEARLGKVPKGIILSWAEMLGLEVPSREESITIAQQLFDIEPTRRQLEGSIAQQVAELEASSLPFSPTIAQLRVLIRKLSLTTWETIDREDKVLLSWLPFYLLCGQIFARAEQEGKTKEFIDSIINGAKKLGKVNAPFVKLS